MDYTGQRISKFVPYAVSSKKILNYREMEPITYEQEYLYTNILCFIVSGMSKQQRCK